MSNLNDKWTKFNDDRVSKRLSTISFEEWFTEYYRKDLVTNSIKYLDLDREGPNWGTKNKQELMKRTLYYISNWRYGSSDLWVSKLSNRLGLTPRTVRENYLDPLIKEGLIAKAGSQLHFAGPPEEVSEE